MPKSGQKQRYLKVPLEHSFFLFGPRQVGKSTLIKEVFQQKHTMFYDLLKSEQYKRLLRNPQLLREELKSRSKEVSHVVIDEIQKIPELLDEVHYILENQDKPPYFILSGSSARKLKRGGANMMGGRVWIRELYPFIESELEEDFHLIKALELGTLPSVYLSSQEDAIEELRAYVSTYLNEEIKAEALVRNLDSFVQFLQFAAEENGNIVNYSNIAKATGVSSTTIKEYFHILEDTLIGFFLLPYSRSHRTRLVKHPKFYFFDTGVQRALASQLTLCLQPGTKVFGNVFEHFLIKEIIHLSKYLQNDFKFSFYRTEAGAEVDLIIETPDKTTYAVEIKSSDDPQLQYLGGLKSFKKNCPEAKLICASQAPYKRELGEIMIYPWQDFLEKIEQGLL